MLVVDTTLMDGIDRHIATISLGLKQQFKDCDVAVCTVFPYGDVNKLLEASGVQTFSLNCTSGHDWKIIPRFYKIVKEYRPDVIHSHVMALFVRIVLSLFFRNIHYVQTIHGLKDRWRVASFRQMIEYSITKIFSIPISATCVVSRGLRESLVCLNRTKNVHIVYNPIDFKGEVVRKYQLHKIIGVSKQTPIIGTACRLALVKDPFSFTKVMCEVLRQNKDVHAVVLGDGEDNIKKDLCDLVFEYGVSERFHWLGYRGDAVQLLRDFNCFVMTSVSEGLPTTILEAMANFVPFAMFEGLGGLKDIMTIDKEEGPIGLVIPNRDIPRMVSEICNLLRDTDLQQRIAIRSNNIGRKYFDVDSVVKQLHNIYSQVCVR